ncbi:helix-turn-helix domain-containing protein [Cellvibrio sp. OA-2007]|uniref:helix-turn-helix domain-containing protein n=1 Tax=Cellvibrio sp. OA-2007 TaxID=529823 RepID=UPI0007824336|nr:helix-turn-helix domain-containing protein [Cellvibrio sp. OA-2007]
MSNDATGIETSLNITIISSESADTASSTSVLLDTAARIKLIREAFGFSQRELAKRAGVTNSSISMIEQGQVSPSIQSLSRILAVFPISLADFFNFQLPVDRQANNVVTSLNGHDSKVQQRQLDARIECLSAGQFTAFSTAAVDSCGVLLSGCLQLTLLSGGQMLGQGDSFYVPASQPYRLINLSSYDASLFRCSLFVHQR